jgi:polysaccharide export outer membrane protein
MFKSDKNYKYETPPENAEEKYKISKNDIIEFKLLANEGFVAVDYASSNGAQGGAQNFNRISLNYYVENDGTVKLPILGKVNIKDSTIRAAEFMLEQMYSEYYVEPFVQIQVVNKRIIVFPGNGSDARVIPLTNNNTTLTEALAMAGGITDRGRANSIKVIRRDGNERKVYKIDLSTIDGLKYADMIVQANDYIYVEPTPQYAREVLTQVAPYVSLLSSAILIYTVFQRAN